MGEAVRRMAKRLRDERGQATVEAAVSLPVIFTLLLMLIQPSIILYDRLVMSQAAAEGCRVLMTSGGSGDDLRICEDYIRRRLSAVPQQSSFHVHDEECTWEIELAGSSATSQVSVAISTEVKPLPLFDAAAALANVVNERGNLIVEVEVSMDTQPSWFVSAGMGAGASSWVGAWLHD